MVNTHRATGLLAVRLDEDVSTANSNFPVNTTVRGNNASEWLRVIAGTTIGDFDCVAVAIGGTAMPVTHALARAGLTIGVAQNALTSGNYGWVAVNGHSLQVSTLAAEAVGVSLYTTDTAGHLADATASASAALIMGLTLVATASGSTASSAAVILRNPVARKTIADA